MTTHTYLDFEFESDEPDEIRELLEGKQSERERRQATREELAAVESEITEHYRTMGATDFDLGVVPDHLVDAAHGAAAHGPDTFDLGDFPAPDLDPFELPTTGHTADFDPAYLPLDPIVPAPDILMRYRFPLPFDVTLIRRRATPNWSIESTQNIRAGRIGASLATKGRATDNGAISLVVSKMPPYLGTAPAWTRYTVHYMPYVPQSAKPAVPNKMRYQEVRGPGAGAATWLEMIGSQGPDISAVRSLHTAKGSPHLRRSDRTTPMRSVARSMSIDEAGAGANRIWIQFEMDAYSDRGGFAHNGCAVQLIAFDIEHFGPTIP